MQKNKIYAVIGILALLSISFIGGYVYAPSGTNYTISQGVYPGAPEYTIWVQSGTYYAKNDMGAIDYQGTNATLVFNNAISSGGLVFVKQGTYSFDVDNTVTLVSNLILEGERAILTTPSHQYTQAWLLRGVNVDNVTVRGFVFDGQVGVDVSGVETLHFLRFEGGNNIVVENNQAEFLSGTLVTFQTNPHSNITVRNNIVGANDNGVTGGIVTFDYVTSGIISGNIVYVWDSGPLIARSSHIVITDNIIISRRGICIDVIIQLVTDLVEDIDISHNRLIGPTEFGYGQAVINIHDTGVNTTSGIFRKINIADNYMWRDIDYTQNLEFIVSNPVEGVTITNNQIFGGGKGIMIVQRSHQYGWVITGNTIAHINGTGGASYAIINMDAGTGHALINAIINDNIIVDAREIFRGIFYNSSFQGNVLGDWGVGNVTNRQTDITIFNAWGGATSMQHNIIQGNQFKTKGAGTLFTNTPIDSSNYFEDNMIDGLPSKNTGSVSVATGGTVFLSLLIFTRIFQQGFFLGYESNPLVLYLEYALICFTVFYYLLMCKEYIFGGKTKDV